MTGAMASRPPVRVQRCRTPGWRTPTDPAGRPALYVGRGTRWGNPYRVHPALGHTAEWAARAYVADLRAGLLSVTLVDVAALRGRDLSCWCQTGAPCHADALLRLANPQLCAPG